MRCLSVLFVCTHNGTRSQIARQFTQRAAAGRVEAFSSSFEPEDIGPLPIAVMREADIELQKAAPKSVFERFRDGERFDYVISICDPAGTEQVPIFLSSVDSLYHETARRLNWSIPNFRSLSGTDEDKKIKARQIRDQIKSNVLAFLSQLGVNTDPV